MRKITTAIIALFIFNTSFAEEAEELAKELLVTTGASEMGQQVMTQMVMQMKQAMPQVPGEFWDKFLDQADTEELMNLIIPIYVKYLSVDDMKAILEFYKTPAGKNFIANQGLIMQESMQVGQMWGMQIGEKVAREVQEQFGQ